MAALTQNDLKKLRLEKKKEFIPADKKVKNTQIIIGLATCGIAAGAAETYEAFAEQIKKQKLTNVTLRKTGCIGLCSVEPTVEIIRPGEQSVVYGNVLAKDVEDLFNEHVMKGNHVERLYHTKEPNKKQIRIVLRNCGIINPESIDDYIAQDGYAALEKVLFEIKPDQVIEELKKSGLRGRGGAGFPTWKKWIFTKDVQSDTKYIVCNADEGDPGAYMDRSTLEGDPHSILEAMIIAGYTVGAKQGYIYIRAEYPLAIKNLEIAIEQAKKYGLLGKNILGSKFDFDIELRLGAGAFVCGEETALLASIEGHRGMPKPRPPFPAVKGLWNKPTVINNVETLANIPVIILKGGDWFAKIGTGTSKGTKVFAVTGKIKNSGLIEVPMGITLREIIYDICGGIIGDKKFKAVQTGGPSGGVIPAQFLDTPIDYDNLQKLGSIMGSGGMIVMDEDDCMIDVSKFYLYFTIDESCGKCAPCRIGGRQLYEILKRISKGQGKMEDLEKIHDLSLAMQKASLCGLGQTSSNPVISTLKYFTEEYLEHINDKKCRSGKCKELSAYTILPDKCIGCGMCFRKCPVNAISGEKGKVHVIDQAKCIKCGECYAVCKFKAVSKS